MHWPNTRLQSHTKQVGGGPVAACIHNSIAHTCKYGKVYQVGDTKNMRVKLTYHKTEFKMIEQHEDSMSHFCTLISLHCTSTSTGSPCNRRLQPSDSERPCYLHLSKTGSPPVLTAKYVLHCSVTYCCTQEFRLRSFINLWLPPHLCGLRDWLLTNNPCESIIVESLLNNQSHE